MNALNRLRRRIPLLIWILISFVSLSPRNSHSQNLPPALMVEENERAKSLKISKVDIEVRIHGFIADKATSKAGRQRSSLILHS